MIRLGTVRQLVVATLAVGLVGLIGTAALAQPRPPLDPLAEARARQKIADQKAEIDVGEAIALADKLARTNPAKAAQILRNAQTNIDTSAALSAEARKSLTATLQAKITALDGKPLANPGPKADPSAALAKAMNKAAYESYTAELKAVKEGVDRVAKYKQAGLAAEAEREIAALAKNYPNNPSIIRLQEQDGFANRVDDSLEYARQMDKRVTLALRDVDRSSLPPTGDIEFPKDWKEKTERRMQGPKLTDREKKIIEALDKPVTVNWNGKMLEEALQELSTLIDQNLLLDKKSLTDLGVDLQKNVDLKANRLSARTVLRQILAAQGLTFVVKDETIQVVTVEKARTMLVTRVYYLGDVVRGGAFNGAAQFGTFLDFQQTMQNVDTIIKTITSTIDPLSWKENGGPCSITFHYPSMSIIVRASTEVQATLGLKVGGGR